MPPLLLSVKGLQQSSHFSPFADLDSGDDLAHAWKTCTKVRDTLENGNRLENLSWRLWHLHQSLCQSRCPLNPPKRFRHISKKATRKLDEADARQPDFRQLRTQQQRHRQLEQEQQQELWETGQRDQQQRDQEQEQRQKDEEELDYQKQQQAFHQDQDQEQLPQPEAFISDPNVQSSSAETSPMLLSHPLTGGGTSEPYQLNNMYSSPTLTLPDMMPMSEPEFGRDPGFNDVMLVSPPSSVLTEADFAELSMTMDGMDFHPSQSIYMYNNPPATTLLHPSNLIPSNPSSSAIQFGAGVKPSQNPTFGAHSSYGTGGTGGYSELLLDDYIRDSAAGWQASIGGGALWQEPENGSLSRSLGLVPGGRMAATGYQQQPRQFQQHHHHSSQQQQPSRPPVQTTTNQSIAIPSIPTNNPHQRTPYPTTNTNNNQQQQRSTVPYPQTNNPWITAADTYVLYDGPMGVLPATASLASIAPLTRSITTVPNNPQQQQQQPVTNSHLRHHPVLVPALYGSSSSSSPVPSVVSDTYLPVASSSSPYSAPHTHQQQQQQHQHHSSQKPDTSSTSQQQSPILHSPVVLSPPPVSSFSPSATQAYPPLQQQQQQPLYSSYTSIPHSPAVALPSSTPQLTHRPSTRPTPTPTPRPRTIPSAGNSDGKLSCENCSVTSTPLWRRSSTDQLLCNACGLYLKLHATHRPKNLKSNSARTSTGTNEAVDPPATCFNCSTQNTPLWRRDEAGNNLCNACGLYLKLHGSMRPLSMKTDVIRKRQRYDTGNTHTPLSIRTPKKRSNHKPDHIKMEEWGYHHQQQQLNPFEGLTLPEGITQGPAMLQLIQSAVAAAQLSQQQQSQHQGGDMSSPTLVPSPPPSSSSS